MGCTHLFVIIISLRITLNMKLILNCPLRKSQNIVRKPTAETKRGPALCTFETSPSKFQKDSSSPKIPTYWQTYMHSEEGHSFGDNCTWGPLLRNYQYKCLLKLPDSWEGYEGWIWGLCMSVGTLLSGMFTWHDMVKTTLSPAYKLCQSTPLESWFASTNALDWLLFPHFPNTALLGFSGMYAYDLQIFHTGTFVVFGKPPLRNHGNYGRLWKYHSTSIDLMKSWEMCFSFHLQLEN